MKTQIETAKRNDADLWESASSPEDTFVMPQWFVSQNSWVEDPLGSDNLAYSYPILLRLQGALVPDALERSLQRIVELHQIFRAAFHVVNGEMIASIRPRSMPTLPVTDLEDFGSDEKQSRARSLVLEEIAKPFDLSRDLLLRAKLLRLGSEDHLLLLNTHHIACDDWSVGILLRELSIRYGNFADSKPSPLSPLPFRYADFVRWRESRSKNGQLNATLSFRNESLLPSDGFSHLPSDFARPAEQTVRGARESAFYAEDLLKSLIALGRAERVSLFMTLLAAFKCLLHSYSGEEDIGVGSCVANRPLTEAEGAIGPFANVIVIRTKLFGDQTFRESLRRVRESSLTSLSRQDLPFGQLVRTLQPTRALGRKPFCQVVLVLQNAPREQCHIPGVTISSLPLDTRTTPYEVYVCLTIQKGIKIELQYDTDLFRAETMKQILHDYEQILGRMARDPGAHIQDLSISRRAEPVEFPQLNAPAKKTADGAGPPDDVQSRLVELWEAAFGIRPISVDQDFFELGGDSLLAARLFIQMEKTFQMDLPLATLLEAPTIEQLAGTISGRKTRSSGSSLVVIQPLGTKPPLFCVHGHMGELFYCRNLSRSLGADQPLFGLRSQGLLGGESPRYTIEDMAVQYLREIRTVQREGPYFLSGFCFGGMVAYEMARLLKTQGEDVALLVIFNTPVPGSLKGWPLRPGYLAKRIVHEFRKLHILRIREKLAVFRTKAVGLTRLVFGSFKAALWHALARSSAVSAAKGAQRLLSVADINVSAAKSYHPAAYPGRIILFLTEEATSLYAIDPRDGWMALAGDGIEVHAVAGDNNSLFDARFVDALAEKLKSCITRAHANGRKSSAKP